MNRILLIGWTDLRVFLRARTSYIWLFGVPVVFIGFMGLALRGQNTPYNLRPTVLVEKLDTNYLARVFMGELGKQGLRVIKPPTTEKSAQHIRIPADFTERILAGRQARVEFSNDDTTVSAEGAMVQLRLVRAVVAINSDLLSASAKGGAGVRAAAAAAGLPLVGNGAEAPFTESAVCAAQAAPALVTLDARFAGRKPAPSGFNFSLPGNMVTYIMMNLLIFGATGLARQRRFGIVRRLACGPVRRFDIVGGKICGLMLLGGVQAAVMLLAGRFVFKVHLGANLGAVLVTLVVYSWVAASLGVLVGSVLHAEDKVVGVCVLTALLMGALGGGWWPLEIGPEWMRTVAHCLPTGWALDCLHQVISFGGGFAEIARPLGVLALFGAGFNALAAMLFRW